MRILSQGNGKYDLQYENIVLEKMTDGNTIYAYTGTGQPFKMASYSSTDKMDKAMEMLRKAYSPILVIDDVSDEHIKADIKPFITPIRAGRPNVEVMDNYYFQFPQDNEIEVQV